VGVVAVAAGAAIEVVVEPSVVGRPAVEEVVVEPSVVGRPAVEEVVGAAASSPPEPPLLHPVAARAPATTIAVSTRPSCRPAVCAMHT
jgi:hypothetical protein